MADTSPSLPWVVPAAVALSLVQPRQTSTAQDVFSKERDIQAVEVLLMAVTDVTPSRQACTPLVVGEVVVAARGNLP